MKRNILLVLSVFLVLTLSFYVGGKQEDSGSGEVDLTGKTIEIEIQYKLRRF